MVYIFRAPPEPEPERNIPRKAADKPLELALKMFVASGMPVPVVSVSTKDTGNPISPCLMAASFSRTLHSLS